MNQWLQEFVSNHFRSDKSDRSDRSDKSDRCLSLLSPVTWGSLNYSQNNIPGISRHKAHLSLLSPKGEKQQTQNLNEGVQVTSDRSDKLHLSGISDQKMNLYDQDLQTILKVLTDKPDTWIQSIVDAFEERCAIVEYDGGKSALEAQCTAYREVLIKVLSAHDDINSVSIERR